MTQKIPPCQWFAAILRDKTPLFTDLWQVGLENRILALTNHEHANSETRDSIPQTFRDRLQKYALNVAATELRVEHELRQELSLFNNTDIPFLLMKGTPLAYTHYPQPYLRSRCDTDLLFTNRDDAERAWQLLKDLT